MGAIIILVQHELISELSPHMKVILEGKKNRSIGKIHCICTRPGCLGCLCGWSVVIQILSPRNRSELGLLCWALKCCFFPGNEQAIGCRTRCTQTASRFLWVLRLATWPAPGCPWASRRLEMEANLLGKVQELRGLDCPSEKPFCRWCWWKVVAPFCSRASRLRRRGLLGERGWRGLCGSSAPQQGSGWLQGQPRLTSPTLCPLARSERLN